MKTPQAIWDPAFLGHCLVAGFGWWQLLFTLVVRRGGTFNDLLWLSPLALIAAIATVGWATREQLTPHEAPNARDDWPASLPELATALVATGGVIAWQVGAPWEVVLLLGGIHLGVLAWPRHEHTMPTASTPFDRRALLALMVTGAVLSLGLTRPEGDDGFYLAQAAANLEYPDMALLSFDVLHGDVGLPIQQVAHRAQGFETFVSLVIAVTGLYALDAYYILLPAIFGACVAPAYWLAARSFFGRELATVTAAVAMALVLLWAGHYYALGNWGFVRIFQGKGLLVSVFLPLLIWRSHHVVVAPSASNALHLTLAASAAAACTSTALLVTPMAIGLVLLAGMTPNRRGLRVASAGALSVMPIAMMLAFVQIESSTRENLGRTGKNASFEEFLGGPGRAGLAVFALIALPLALKLAGRRSEWMARYGLVSLLVLMNGWTSNFIADHAGRLFSWRIYWALPFALITAGFCVALAERVISDGSQRARVVSLVALAAFFGLFASADIPTTSMENHTRWSFASWKLPVDRGPLGQAVIEATTKDDLLLMPELSAVYTVLYPEGPRFVAVRQTYLGHLRFKLGPPETRQRIRMMEMVGIYPNRRNALKFYADLDHACVTALVATPVVTRKRTELAKELKKRGFTQTPLPDEAEGFSFWQRSPDSCPSWSSRWDKDRTY